MRRLAPFAVTVLVVAVVGVLAGCARATPTPTPLPGPTPTPTPFPVVTVSPHTPTPVPPPTPTATPYTPTPIPSPTPTATPTPPPRKLRSPEEATPDNPLTREEIEALLEKHRGETLRFVSWGGAYQAGQRKAWLEPFSEKFGIKILEESNPTNAKLQAMVESGNVTWDVADKGVAEAWTLGPKGLLEELDFRIVDQRYVFERSRTPWTGGAGIAWDTAMAFRNDYQPRPTSWADFWDVENFPGRRGYQPFVEAALEFALMSAGYKPQDITYPYTPEMEELAFAKLEELAPNVSVWWDTGSTPPEMLISRELDLTTTWTTRIRDAALKGAPLTLCFECGHVVMVDFFVIPKGSPNKELAQLFIAWTAIPEIAVRISPELAYGPANTKATELMPEVLPPELLPWLPTSPENIKHAVVVDEKWVGANYDRLYQRILEIAGR